MDITATTGQIFIVSQNKFLNCVYRLNLEIYTGIEATFCETIEEALSLSNSKAELLKVIMCEEKLVQEVPTFYGQIKARSNTLGLVFGLKSESHENVQSISNKFDIRDIIRKVAGYLGVTAACMAKKEVPEFYPIEIDLFTHLTTALSDIFIQTDDDYAKIFSCSEKIDKDFGLLKKNGNDNLYIRSTDRLTFINKATIYLLDFLREDELTNTEVLELSAQGMDIVAEDIFSNEEVSREVAEISKICIDSIQGVADNVAKAKNLIALLLENKSGYVFSHSVLATYIATNIIRCMDWGSKEQQEKVSFVLFFHDLYLVPIYNKYDEALDEENLLFRDDVSEEDKEVIFDHASMISAFIRTFPRFPMGADSLAAQHHGSTTGKGFPGMFNDDISPLAKVIVISEEITKHILENVYAKNVEGAFDKAAVKLRLEAKFTRSTYRKLIEAFDKIPL